MEHSDGEIASKKPKLSYGGSGSEDRFSLLLSAIDYCDGEIATKQPKLSGGGGEDLLSALPDDLLINIVLKLQSSTAAARTCVLSRRWRRIWALLPELRFSSPADSHGIRPALIAPEAPVLRHISVGLVDPSPDSLLAWLPIAARRLSGDLIVTIKSESNAGEICAFELPCFESATSISLNLGHLCLAMPPTGVFARLTDFSLFGVNLYGTCMLGDALSSPRCPSLRTLTVHDTSGLGSFTIHSESLLEIKLSELHDFQQLTVMAPALKRLTVNCCFHDESITQPVANVFAPQLVSLQWRDGYDPNTVQLSKIAHLQFLGTDMFLPYGADNSIKMHNTHCTELLRHFNLIDTLEFILYYPPSLHNCQYLMEDIRRLPSIKFMNLNLIANGHSFGAGLFHVLRMCTGLRKLTVDFLTTPVEMEARISCPPDCICGQQPNWKTEQLVLDCLQEVQINCLRATEHESALVKRLFDCATVLKKMAVNFHASVTQSKVREFCQPFRSSSRPEVCLLGLPSART